VLQAQRDLRVVPDLRTSRYALVSRAQAAAAEAAAFVAYRDAECAARSLPAGCVLDVGPDGQRLSTPITTAYVRAIRSDDGTVAALPLDAITRAALGGAPAELEVSELPTEIRARLGDTEGSAGAGGTGGTDGSSGAGGRGASFTPSGGAR